MSELNQWFDKGMTQTEYVKDMKTHKDHLLKVYNEFTVPEDHVGQLRNLQSKNIRAIVLTEDWCGDAMVNLPIFMRMADEALIEVRYLLRDKNLELMDQYLTNGTARSIPIFIFINEKGEEIGKWGPRAPEAQRLVEGWKKDLPSKEDLGYDKAFRNFAEKVAETFTADRELWSAICQDIMLSLS